MPELFVIDGTCGGTVFFLPEVPTMLGRSPECHVQIGDLWISSMHALFERRGDELWVIDLDSRNGTFLDGNRIKESAVRVGSRLRFGRTSTEIRESRPLTVVPDNLLLERGTVVRYLADLRDELADVRTIEARRRTIPGSPRPQTSSSMGARRQAALLNDLARALVEAIGLDDALARILKTATDALGADRSAFMLTDESGKLVSRVHQPEDGSPLVSEALLTAAARSRAGILSLDAQQDLRFSASTSIISQGIRSCICSPVWADNRILGMLLFDRAPGDPFTADDLELAALVGYQAAIAVDRARFFERARSVEQRHIELLRHFSPELAGAAAERESLERDPLDLALRPSVTAVRVLLDGTAPLSLATEPEPVARFLCDCLENMARLVWENGGVVESKTSVGLTGLFGLLDAEQDASGRALRCALAIQSSFEKARGSMLGVTELALRIGAEEGPVLAGNCGPVEKPEFVAFGEAVDAAIRLAVIAAPGSVAVGPRLKAAAGSSFDCKPIQATPMPEIPLFWAVSGASPPRV